MAVLLAGTLFPSGRIMHAVISLSEEIGKEVQAVKNRLRCAIAAIRAAGNREVGATAVLAEGMPAPVAEAVIGLATAALPAVVADLAIPVHSAGVDRMEVARAPAVHAVRRAWAVVAADEAEAVVDGGGEQASIHRGEIYENKFY
jgi:hypothetical protein